MNTQKRIWTFIVVVIIIVIIFAVAQRPQPPATTVSTVPPPVTIVPPSTPSTVTYQNSAEGFSIQYPKGFTVDDAYQYQELGPGKDINGVKFTIAPSIAAGTNLSSDSYISVEQIPNTQTCTANLFLDQGTAPMTMTDNGTTYSMATSNGAGAGNRYDETVYAIPGSNPCIAVRYFVHYGAIENYPPGAVQQFNEQALISQFDTIRRTLVITQ